MHVRANYLKDTGLGGVTCQEPFLKLFVQGFGNPCFEGLDAHLRVILKQITSGGPFLTIFSSDAVRRVAPVPGYVGVLAAGDSWNA